MLLNLSYSFFAFATVVAVIVVTRLLCICPGCFHMESWVSWGGVQIGGIALLQRT